MKMMIKIMLLGLCSLTLLACTTIRSPQNHRTITVSQESHLEQGKRYFNDGYYKRAMHELLPLACDGIAEAQYAVGYMYYYGYGVAQDTDVGHFWIKRSADQGFEPARKALLMIDREKDASFHARDQFFKR